MTEPTPAFAPNRVSPPGDTMQDMLDELGWTLEEFARRLDHPPEHVSQLLNGKVSLTVEIAMRLSTVLGSSVGFWLNREANFRERIARQEMATTCTDRVVCLQ
ncbi:MAG: HigA family addiction module antidote protein [Magnetococcales bacterium]|nr:HigA family addiction module antidote protein [Magnetococcales bacterium]